MLDRPHSRSGWETRAAALRIEGRSFVDGRYVGAASGRAFARISPIDGRTIAEVADNASTDVDAAVNSARRAFEDGRWRNLAPAARKSVLLRFAALMRENLDELALLETLDVGKVIGNSLAVDVPFAADCIQYYGEMADKLFDEVAPVGHKDVALVRREPLGVVAAIVPWNYPLIISAWKTRPGAGGGQFRDPEAGRTIVDDRHPPGRPGGRGRSSRTACSTCCPASARPWADLWRCTRDVDMVTLHGLDRGRQADDRAMLGESNMKRVSPGMRRQEPACRDARRRPRRRRLRHRLGHLLQSGRDVPRGLPRHRPPLEHAGGADRQGRRHAARARSRSATRSTPRRRWAR